MRVIYLLIAFAISTAFYAQVNSSLGTDTAVGFAFLPTSLPLSNKVYNAIGNSVTTVSNGQITANCVIPANVTLSSSGKLVFTNGFKANSSSNSTFKAAIGNSIASKSKKKDENLSALDDSNIVVFPNPTNDFIKINWGNAKISKVFVVNLEGKVVYFNDNNLVSKKDLQIDVKSFSVGVYTIMIEHIDKTYNYRKFIKIL